MCSQSDPATLGCNEVLKLFDSNTETGLNESQIKKMNSLYGFNELPPEEKTSLWKLFVEQFDDTLVRILLIAAIISAILGVTDTSKHILDMIIEPLVIMIVLIVNALISIKQTLNAEEALEALREYEPELASVLRYPSNTFKIIKSRDLVPGDIVQVRVGDRVPADIRILKIESTVLKADQSILTGESHSVLKHPDSISGQNLVNQDRVNMLFSGTNVVAGKCMGIVVKTGINTEIGKIRENIASIEEQRTPLQKKLDQFGNQLSILITVICIGVWVINVHHFDDPFHGNSWIKGAVYYFKIAISLAVAAIPEGLPAVITTCLAIGTRRMAKNNAIVRSIRSVETLGCTSVICSDKTGTITTNQMSVRKFFVVGSPENSQETVRLVNFGVNGTTYDYRDGNVDLKDSVNDLHLKTTLEELTDVCCLCNDASLGFEKNTVYRIGEPTEAALLTFSEKMNIYDVNRTKKFKNDEDGVKAVYNFTSDKYDKLSTLEFSRDRKSMSAFCLNKSDKKFKLLVKGAPENIISRCAYVRISGNTVKLTKDISDKILSNVHEYACGRTPLRCLAFAIVDDCEDLRNYSDIDTSEFSKFESNMTFVGVIGMMDPPREQVHKSLEECKKAGIRVIVITGDNKDTAEAICRNVGIISEEDDSKDVSYSASDFDRMNKKEQLMCCERAKLFTRVEPSHKSRIVSCLQELGEITAMTGDGVNDAPALKKAEIGVAMGSGTAVAKSASDIVLADDNFSSIVSAVQEGRAIFANTIQFISYLVSSNIGEVVCIFVTSMLGLPEGLIPVQLLWVNLITDGLPATALGFNPPDPHVMVCPPRNPSDPLISRWQMIRYMIIGLYVGLATVIGSVWWYLYDSTGPHLTFLHLIYHQNCSATDPMYAGIDCEIFNHYTPMTMALTVLVLSEMLNACNSMSNTESIFVIPPWRNSFLVLAIASSMIIHVFTLYFPLCQTIFSVSPLSFNQWMVALALSVPVIIIDEILKLLSCIQEKREASTKKKTQ